MKSVPSLGAPLEPAKRGQLISSTPGTMCTVFTRTYTPKCHACRRTDGILECPVCLIICFCPEHASVCNGKQPKDAWCVPRHRSWRLPCQECSRLRLQPPSFGSRCDRGHRKKTLCEDVKNSLCEECLLALGKPCSVGDDCNSWRCPGCPDWADGWSQCDYRHGGLWNLPYDSCLPSPDSYLLWCNR